MVKLELEFVPQEFEYIILSLKTILQKFDGIVCGANVAAKIESNF